MTRKRPTKLIPRGFRVPEVRVGDMELAVLSYDQAAVELPQILTKVEREVADAILLGKSNRDIADQRGTALRTIANQVASVFRKCGVASRAELIAKLRDAP